MPRISESSTVQEPLLRYAAEAGWTRLEAYEATAMRRGDGGLLLQQVFVEQVQRLNPGLVDLARAEELARRLAAVPPTIEGNLQAWEFLRGLRTVYLPEERRERNVRLLDADHVDRNRLHVAEELTYDNGTHRIRPDVVFFVNGVPVLVVEAKAPTLENALDQAMDQLVRYHRQGPELLALLQLQSLTNLRAFRYGATWVLSLKYLFDWHADLAAEMLGPADFETRVKHFVSPSRVLRMLTEFILFTRKDDELSKVVLRPHQMRAVERVLGRARERKKRRGLVWHTQGSGKTYTMMLAAKLLIQDPSLGHPTVLMLVDRNELETQLFGNLEAAGFGQVTVAESKAHLRDLLRSDQRGLIVSMIHKFDDIPADSNTRHNIYVLVDEAHRTTGGDLGNYLMGALPNATYIGFTGTPIDRTSYGQGTFKVFGFEDPQGYLDKYSIAESIRDGTTVPLHYQLAPSDMRVDRETLDREFLDLAEAEGMSDTEELNKVLERAVTLRNMLKNRERIERVAEHMARHFTTTVQPMGYKAFVVAVDREACALYKEALDRHLPPEQSVVVYSAGHNDTSLLARHHLTREAEKAVRKAYTRPDQEPSILIVTDKLLTGFDAPILYCMYLDKPMRDHVLLQAIARVNRPLEDAERRKTAGLIYDFVGIFENLEKALAFDSRDVDGVVEGLDVLQEQFVKLMRRGRAEYLTVWAGLQGDKAVEAALERFRDEEPRGEFLRFYRELEDVYEILSPDPFLRPHLEAYEELTQLFRLVRAAYMSGPVIDREFLRKTASLVQEHTRATGIVDPTNLTRLDGETLERLAAEETSDTVKVFNLVKAFQELVRRQGMEAPFLIPIGERAEAIAKAFEERLKSAQEAVEELERLVDEYQQAYRRREESDLSREAFGVYWLLQSEELDEAEQVARAVEPAFAAYPHWARDGRQEQEVRLKLYKSLMGTSAKPRMADIVKRILDVLRRATE